MMEFNRSGPNRGLARACRETSRSNSTFLRKCGLKSVMLSRLAKSFPACVLASFSCVFIVPTLVNAQGATNIGEIVRDVDRDTIRVSVASPDTTLAGLLQVAFGLHGAFDVVADRGQFRLIVEPAGANSVSLRIQTGEPARTVFDRKVSGTDLSNAALRAADLAVEGITEVPGIFASQLVFLSDRDGKPEIYTSNLVFSSVRQQTRHRSLLVHPRWSPDSTKVIYTSYHRNGSPDIYILDLAQRTVSTFASYNGTNTGAVFSPDGTTVAFTAGAANSDLYTKPIAGGSPKRLTQTRALEADPTWSRDGTQIVVVSDERGGPQLYRLSATGGAMRRLQTAVSGYCAEPDWNPQDSRLIAFTAGMGGVFQIALFDMGLGSSTVLTKGSADAVEPRWMRDGRHLIYTERTRSSKRVMLLDTQTGQSRPLHKPDFGNSWAADAVY